MFKARYDKPACVAFAWLLRSLALQSFSDGAQSKAGLADPEGSPPSGRDYCFRADLRYLTYLFSSYENIIVFFGAISLFLSCTDAEKNIIVFFGAISLFLSCTDAGNETDSPTAVYDVDPTFEPYVQKFIQEGAQRGQNIDFTDSGLRVQFSELALPNSAGFCRLGRYDVEIDKSNWYRFSEQFRSYLLFHELGHCVLNRIHKNDRFADDTWKSIMRGDPFTGIENRFPVAYYGFREEHYLDELFNSQTSDPW